MPPEDERERPDFLERRGLGWGLMLALLIPTLVVALVLAYLVTVRNMPHT
jgi:ABC-type Fe3+ transport system permease subunit